MIKVSSFKNLANDKYSDHLKHSINAQSVKSDVKTDLSKLLANLKVGED